MRRSPPVMSLTFLAKSSAYSWKMSFDGQVLCHRMLTGPCAFTTAGAATLAAVATAAPLRNLRRDVLAPSGVFDFVIGVPPIRHRGPVRPRPKRAVGNDVYGSK